MIAYVKKCLAFLPPRLRWRWAALLPLALVAAALETVGAAAVFFLIKVVSDPAAVADLPLASALSPWIDWSGGHTTVAWLSLAVAIFYLFKNGMLAVFAYSQRK